MSTKMKTTKPRARVRARVGGGGGVAGTRASADAPASANEDAAAGARVRARDASRVSRAVASGTAPGADVTASAGTRKRQARGEKRIEAILDAAARVFADGGYEPATTNAIAAAAGISPGSLYQFFGNKEQIAERLAARYAEQLEAVHARALDPAVAALPLAKAIDRMVDPFLAFHRDAIGFDALFVGSSASPPLDETVRRGLEAVFHARAPKVDPHTIRLCAFTCMRLFKALLPTAISGSKAEQREATQELKTVLRRYMEPVIG